MDATVKILNLISERGMTDAQFTRETGISNGLIGQWRTGKQKPSLKNIQKIADRFGMDVREFLSDGAAATESEEWVNEITISPVKTAAAKMLAGMSDEHAAILKDISSLDQGTLLQIEKIIDMIKAERK